MVIVATEVFVLSAAEVAVTVAVGAVVVVPLVVTFGSVAGAVYNPAALLVPQAVAGVTPVAQARVYVTV